MLNTQLTKKIKFHKPLRAFSLVEISIAILVIGILIAGVSSGLDLYQDFRLAQARQLTKNSIVGRMNGLTLWLETTSENSFNTAKPLNNDKIALWKDINPQRAFKINVSQSNESKQPTYIEFAINNLPALRFVNNIEMRSANIELNDFISTNQATIFLVQNNFSGDTTTTTISWIPTSSNTDSGEVARFNIHALESNKLSFDFEICCSLSSRTTSPTLSNFLNRDKIISFVKNSNNVNFRVNFNETTATNSVATSTLSPSLNAPFIVGKFRTDNNYFFNGNIGEIIIFDRALNDIERKKIEDYLSDKWAIPIPK